MWQVPVEEINRPGSFSSHARKNLELLVSVLAELKETQSLLQLAQLLKPKPDQTKRYLRDNERVAMHTKVWVAMEVESPYTPREVGVESSWGWSHHGGGVIMGVESSRGWSHHGVESSWGWSHHGGGAGFSVRQVVKVESSWGWGWFFCSTGGEAVCAAVGGS